MAGPHGDWPSSTTTKPVVQNQVSPGHPGGGYNPNQNQISPPVTTTNQRVNTGTNVQNQVSPGHPGGGYDPNQTDPFDEKGDYMDWDYVNPNTGKTARQMAAEAEMQGEKDRLEKEKQARLKAGKDISSAIGSTGTTQQELEYMLSHNTMSPELAVKFGLAKPVMAMTPDGVLKPTGSYIDAKTGKPYVPKDYGFSSNILTTAGGETVDDWKKGVLGDIQLMQDEGVYGGVSGNEAVTNELKGNSVEAIKKLEAQGLSPDEIKSAMQSHPDFKGLVKMFGGNVDTALLNTVGAQGMRGLGFWDKETFEKTGHQTQGDVGYDPTGTKTFSGLTEDEYKHKFLKRGELWDDPLSGIFNQQPTPQRSGYYDNRPTLIDQRKERQRQLFYGPKASPIKDLEQSGFMNTMGSKMNNPYLKDMMDTLKGGLYSKTYVNPAAGFKPWGLEKHYATGKASPLYKNVARGGIMSVWNDRR